jgi:N-acetyltransferase
MKIDFYENIILENERVLIQKLEVTDFEKLLNFSLNEPEIWQYSLVQAIGDNGLKNYLNLAIEARNQEKEYPFLVFDKLKNKYAGSTRFYDIQFASATTQLGYTWYGKEFQGTGLNKNCKFLLLQYAFETLKLQRVEFRADNDNIKSIAAMKSIGCMQEGILRSNGFKANGASRDSIVLSILQSEWHENIKQNLLNKISK